jgi:membrane-bound lytic murein transglycosylase B
MAWRAGRAGVKGWAFGLALCLFVPFAAAEPEFALWLAALRAEALAEGIRESTLDRALNGLEPIAEILERDTHQPEFVLDFATYRDRILKPETIAEARALYRRYQPLLDDIERTYGVPGPYVLAIWGIETRFGTRQGGHPIIPALATLAFDTRRPAFFRRELIAALRILDREEIALEDMRGSWAGAMGQPQFMPTSYLAFAQDYDGDGRRDIWHEPADVFASIANYLAQHGWVPGGGYAREVILPKTDLGALTPWGRSGCAAFDRASRDMTLADWRALDVTYASGRSLPPTAERASLVRPDGTNGPSFLVGRNYRSVLRYNCAHHYGLTVGELAESISRR